MLFVSVFLVVLKISVYAIGRRMNNRIHAYFMGFPFFRIALASLAEPKTGGLRP
jgi:hypothetical protein